MEYKLQNMVNENNGEYGMAFTTRVLLKCLNVGKWYWKMKDEVDHYFEFEEERA
jgi:hypothetical protein